MSARKKEGNKTVRKKGRKKEGMNARKQIRNTLQLQVQLLRRQCCYLSLRTHKYSTSTRQLLSNYVCHFILLQETSQSKWFPSVLFLLRLEKRLYLGQIKLLNGSTHSPPCNGRVPADSVVNLKVDFRRQQVCNLHSLAIGIRNVPSRVSSPVT